MLATLVGALTGCTEVIVPAGQIDTDVTVSFDEDGDGYGVEEDCDDSSPYISPAVSELCNGIDDDCDGEVDNGVGELQTFYSDVDGDGFGVDTDVLTGCEQPEGYADATGDCNDANAAVNPGASEDCNGVDTNCNGVVDDDMVEQNWYPDTDVDGYGDSAAAVLDCFQPTDYIADGTDCDDGDNTVHPSATETCNGVDDDCDGSVDVGATDLSLWFQDSDNDGYGDPIASFEDCSGDGASSNGDDCDDSDAAVHPGATEICDGQQNDCDASWSGDLTATFTDSATSTDLDLTALFAAGGIATPAVWSSPEDGTLSLCGTIYAQLQVMHNVTIDGVDASTTRLDAGGFGTTVFAAGDLSLSNITISGGYAAAAPAGFGGGIYVSGGSADIRDVVIENNHSDFKGGGLWSNGTLTMTDSTVRNNTATELGAGVGTGGEATFTRVVFDGNTGATYGGGYASQSFGTTTTVDECEFRNNEASIGGGIFVNDSATVDVKDTDLHDNSADNGGAFSVHGELSMTNGSATNNEADVGGAIHGQASVTFLYDALIADNSAGSGGAAWLIAGANLICEDTGTDNAAFLRNTAPDAAVFSPDANIVVVSSACDWGEGVDDNGSADIGFPWGGWSYGNNASFFCDGTTGCF